MSAANSIPVHASGHGQPNFPPDITYNPDMSTHVPYSTHSMPVAKALAKNPSSDAVTRALRTKGD